VPAGRYGRATCDRGPTTTDQQQPLANIITLGVRGFAREREFYRQLGWPQAFDSDEFTVFELRGIVLALFGIDQLGTDARAAAEPGHGGIRSSIIITVDQPDDVDALVRRASASALAQDLDLAPRAGRAGQSPVARKERDVNGLGEGYVTAVVDGQVVAKLPAAAE
jgi:catechol 2,3-dioxygenase-like lactoylglutathione lyase family enzyme